MEKGNISIHTENIFPIIKKWLYSDKDIFVRELVSNGCDAINKLKRLVSMGEARVEEDYYKIKITFDKGSKALRFHDNGIGMTDEEVKKYINQVAFSGAEDFIEKYKDKMDEANQIIGHFGLGFYSAFMVSNLVEIDTLSFKDGSTAVKWVCHGGTEYELIESDRRERGTTVTLFLNEDSMEFLDEYKLREVITKHCGFLPVEIYLADENSENQEEAKALNDTNPLWNKSPNQCTEDEYKDFYKKLFHDFKEPLFWIHLNVDYPFNLKGILYFPKFDHEFNAAEGEIKLYNNQVFVADNIKEVIPEFLLLLKGVIDCTDLPLNVSRSFLQNDKNVIKISKHISKKVADKLLELYKNDREKYYNFWEDINVFIKYGCIRENDFYEKVKDVLIFKSINNQYVTLKEYLEKNKENHENKVFYVDNEKQQAQYIRMFKSNGIDAVILDTTIDQHFISFLEMKESGIKFTRIDSDLSETLKEKSSLSEEEASNLKEIFKDALENKKINILVEALRDENIPGILLQSEESRRMQNMKHMFQGMDMGDIFKDEETLVINNNNSLVQGIIKISEDKSRASDINLVCRHIYDLAVIGSKPMDSEELAEFISRSNKILKIIITA